MTTNPPEDDSPDVVHIEVHRVGSHRQVHEPQPTEPRSFKQRLRRLGRTVLAVAILAAILFLAFQFLVIAAYALLILIPVGLVVLAVGWIRNQVRQ